MLDIKVGSIETVMVDVNDSLDNLITLVGTGAVYTVQDKSGNIKMNNQNVIVQAPDLMVARCLIDTTAGGNWSPGHYFLYIRFTASPDSPRLGPLEFKVNP